MLPPFALLAFAIQPRTVSRPAADGIATRIVAAYVAMGGLGLAIAAYRGQPNVLITRAALRLGSPIGAHVTSAMLGALLGVGIVALTQWLARRASFASALHRDLRPFARALPASAVWPLALASAIAEEVLFRGALLPAMGLWASTALFAVVHQVRGSRLTWMLFAAAAGLLFGATFLLTGSLLGAIVAHVLVNAQNLRFLREHDLGRQPALGGLLGKAHTDKLAKPSALPRR